MKNSLKIFTYIFTLFLFGLVVTNTGYASDDLSDSELLKKSKVKIIVTNNQTGETKFLDPIDTKNNMKFNSVQSKNESNVAGY